jgi:hypothetical protein
VHYDLVIVLAVTGLMYFVMFFAMPDCRTGKVKNTNISPIAIAREVVVLKPQCYNSREVILRDEINFVLGRHFIAENSAVSPLFLDVWRQSRWNDGLAALLVFGQECGELFGVPERVKPLVGLVHGILTKENFTGAGLVDGWRFPIVGIKYVGSKDLERDDWERFNIWHPDVRALVYDKSVTGVDVSLQCRSDALLSGLHSALGLMPCGNLFPPLSNSHISIESHCEQGQSLYKQPYPITSFLALFVGVRFVFGGFWLLHFSDYYPWGIVPVLLGLVLLIYRLNGIFDVVEIGTQRLQKYSQFYDGGGKLF